MHKYLLDTICFGTVVLIWIIGAIYNYYKVTVIKRRKSATKGWLLVIIILISIISLISNSSRKLITYNVPYLNIIGSIILIIFTIFTIWSRLILGKMWASDALIKENHKLRVKGPYSITRHPIYTGMLGMLLGSTLRNGIGVEWLVFVCLIVYFKLKIKNEEKLLIEIFGEQYQTFKKTTPQLFPTLKSIKNSIKLN